MSVKTSTTCFSILLLASLLLAESVQASVISDSVTALENFRTGTVGVVAPTVPAFIFSVINVLLGIIAAIALAVLLWAGFTYVTSLGDEDKIRSAKRIILYTIIGLLMVAGAWVIITALKTLISV